jgi:hypothetical protein
MEEVERVYHSQMRLLEVLPFSQWIKIGRRVEILSICLLTLQITQSRLLSFILESVSAG